MQLEDMSKDELIALVKRQEQELAAQPVQQPAPTAAVDTPDVWTLSLEMGALVPNSPRQDGRKRYWLVEDAIAHTASAVEQERYRVQGECEDRIGNLIADLNNARAALAAPVAAPVAGQEPVDIGRLAKLHFYQPDAASMDIRLHRFAMALQAAFCSRAAPVPAASVQPDPEWPAGEREAWKLGYAAARQSDSGRDAALVALMREAASMLQNSIFQFCDTGDKAVDLARRIYAALAAHPANVAQVGELSDAQVLAMPEDITKDDALWRAGCKAFRKALNEMTGQDGYVVKETYIALRSHILAAAKKGGAV